MSRTLEPEIAILQFCLLVEQVAQPRLLDLLLRNHELVCPQPAVQQVQDIEHDHVPRRIVGRVGLRRHGEQEIKDPLLRERHDQVGLELGILDRGRRGRSRVPVREVREVAEHVQHERDDVLVLLRSVSAQSGTMWRRGNPPFCQSVRNPCLRPVDPTHLRLFCRELARMIIMCRSTPSLRIAALYDRCAAISVA